MFFCVASTGLLVHLHIYRCESIRSCFLSTPSMQHDYTFLYILYIKLLFTFDEKYYNTVAHKSHVDCEITGSKTSKETRQQCVMKSLLRCSSYATSHFMSVKQTFLGNKLNGHTQDGVNNQTHHKQIKGRALISHCQDLLPNKKNKWRQNVHPNLHLSPVFVYSAVQPFLNL